MSSNGIQVSCRVRLDCDGNSGSYLPCVRVDALARRLVVAHPPAVIRDSSNLAPTGNRQESEPNSAGTAYSCFDGVYPPHATQEEVFEGIGRPFVAELIAGYNCTIIAYGQTGSGKTYTTVGGSAPDTRGLVPRAVEAILEKMSGIDLAEYNVALTASFVEIYQERLRDLLLPHSSRTLRLREDKERNVCIEGASEISIATVAGGMAVLSRGNALRSTGSTLMNADSSRSHSVLILTFTKKHLASGTKVRGKMFIVDLAGSEKVQKTAATGARMEEAKHINRSLSALGNVINALTDEKVKHVPYRDSRLTRLLQTSLGGNAKTHLLLTCSANIQHMEETLSTLRFGSRAKNIQNSPHINNESTGAAAEYTEILVTLQSKIESLYCYIRQLESSRCQACKSRSSILDTNFAPHLGAANADQLEPAPFPDENPAIDSDGVDCIADDLMQAEMQTLRQTLATMMRDHEVEQHAHHVAQTMMEVAEQQLDSRHKSQEQTIQRQELELQDALATISRLEQKMRLLEESSRGLSAELHHLRGQQHQQQAGENAEVEILRRQLDLSTKQTKQLQVKLTSARQEQEGMTDLKERLMSKDHELKSLRSEMEVLRSKKLPIAVPSAIPVGLPSPHRSPQARPVTAVDFKAFANVNAASRGDLKHGMSNIQNWWAGELSARNQDENGVGPEKCSVEHVLPSTILSGSPSRTRGEAVASCGQDEVLTPAATPTSRVCSSASSSTRPFRARLVGLLNSLEEETTAYKELVVETKERTLSRSGSRPRRQLPCLEALSSSVPPATTP